jgi:outer membrane protein
MKKWIVPLRILGSIGVLVVLFGANPVLAESRTSDSLQPPERLRLEQAILFGLTHHPKLFWYQHRVARQKANVQIAKSHFLPNVGAAGMFGAGDPGASNRPFNNAYQYSPVMPSTFDSMGPLAQNGLNNMAQTADATLGVTQLLYDFGKYEHQTAFQKYLEKAATNMLLVRDAWVILQVREAYYHVILDRKLIEVYQKNLEQRELVRELTHALYRADYKSRLDYDLAVVDYEKAQALLVDEQSDLKTQLARLNESMGLGRESRKDYELLDREPATLPALPLNRLIREGIRSRPELISVQNQYKGHIEKTRSEKALHYPYISAFGSYGYLGNMVSGQSYVPGWWTGGAMMTIPLYTGGLIRGRIANARELSLEDRYHLRDWRIRIRLEVIRAYERIRSDSADIVAFDKAVKEAQLALVLANKKYQANLISIVALTLAEVYLLDTEASLAISQYHLAVDRAALKFASGLDYPEFVNKQGVVRPSRMRLTGIDPASGG